MSVGDGPVGPFTDLGHIDTLDGDVVGSQAGFHVDRNGDGFAWFDTNAPGVRCAHALALLCQHGAHACASVTAFDLFVVPL